MSDRAVSAAEKYAELEALGLERPLSKKGKPMRWNRSPRFVAGGFWTEGKGGRNICRRQGVTGGRPYCIHGPMIASGINWSCSQKFRSNQMKWKQANPEKVRAFRRKQGTRRVRMFGARILMPDLDFVEFARNLRDERKAALKEAS